MITKVIILFFFLFLHRATGAEITSVLLEHHDLVASEGERLLIPCSFKVDDPGGGHQIELEWSVKPHGTDTFRPIIRLDDNGYLHVSEPNERASINPMQVHKGHCTLVIDPVNLNDSGTYQVRMALDGIETTGKKKVNIRVLKSHGTPGDVFHADLHSKDTYTDRPATTEVFKYSHLVLMKFIQVLKNKGYLLYLMIVGGVLFFLFLLYYVAAIVLGCVYLGKITLKAIKLKKEGRMPKKPPEKPDVVIDMDRCNILMKPPEKPDVVIDMDRCNILMKPAEKQDVVIDMDRCNILMKPPEKPDVVIDMDRCNILMKPAEKQDVVIDMDRCNIPMKPADATVPPLKTAPTAEIIKQGCMPMKPPEKQDVVIDMDGCNQLMQPIGAPDLSPETAPKAEMTKEGSMPMKPPEKADVVRDMDECKQPMQPLKTEPQAKRRTIWKWPFGWFKSKKFSHPHSLNIHIQPNEEEKKTEDTNLTAELPMSSTAWPPIVNKRKYIPNPINIKPTVPQHVRSTRWTKTEVLKVKKKFMEQKHKTYDDIEYMCQIQGSQTEYGPSDHFRCPSHLSPCIRAPGTLQNLFCLPATHPASSQKQHKKRWCTVM